MERGRSADGKMESRWVRGPRRSGEMVVCCCAWNRRKKARARRAGGWEIEENEKELRREEKQKAPSCTRARCPHGGKTSLTRVLAETAQSEHDHTAGAARRGVEHDGDGVAQEGPRGRPPRPRYRARARDGIAPARRCADHELRLPGPALARGEDGAAPTVVAVRASALTLLGSHGTIPSSSTAGGAWSRSTCRQNACSCRTSRAISASWRSMR